jgi:glycosyltransferase involved in cell wall biosynthesis
MTPRVSVLLHSYQQCEYLAVAIESVLGQTFTDFELIIIDNGSRDDSLSIARRYLSDERVRLVSHSDNRSLSRRQNEGVALARGEFISFLYSDDYYLPDKLQRQIALFDRLPKDYGVVYAPALGINALTGRQWQHPSIGASGLILRHLLQHFEDGPIDMLSPLTRRQALLRYPFYEDLFAEGESVFFRLAMTVKFQFSLHPVVVLREHDRNIGKAIRQNHESFMKVLDRIATHPDFPRDAAAELPRLRARLLRNAGWQAMRMGSTDAAWARGRFSRAVCAQWRQAFHPRTVLGWGLSLLPDRLRRHINRVASTIRRNPANAIYLDDLR